MTEITLEQLLENLRNYGTAVHCEMYGNYKHWYSYDDISAKFFYDRGCTIVVDEYEYNGKYHIYRKIHQTSPDADIDAVTVEWKAKAMEYAKNFENPEIWIFAFTVSNGELPPEKDKFYGWRNFSRKGKKYSVDKRVRELTLADSEIIKSACTPSLENDSLFGKQLAEAFLNYDFEYWNGKRRIFGIFDEDSLVGMASFLHEEQLDLAWICELFVVSDHRRKSFGRELVLKILSDYPDIKWHYQVAKQNKESIDFAKSLGFTLEGAGLFIT